MNNITVLDIETTGTNPRQDKLHGVGIAWKEDQASYYTEDYSWVKRLLSNPEAHVVGHGVRFDAKFLVEAGFEIRCKLWDTMVLAHLLDENGPLGLKPLSDKLLGGKSLVGKNELDRELQRQGLHHVGQLCSLDLSKKNRPFTKLIAKYCKEDCTNTFKLWHVMTKKLREVANRMKNLGFKQTPLEYYVEEAMPTERVLIAMELNGIAIDEPSLERYGKKLNLENFTLVQQMNQLCKTQIGQVENDLYQSQRDKRKTDKGKDNVKKSSSQHKTRFNWKSNDHLAALIFDKYDTPEQLVPTTPGGKPSTSESSLSLIRQQPGTPQSLKDSLGLYSGWKKNSKIITTYTDEASEFRQGIEEGRIYGRYLQCGDDKGEGGTVTGRLSARSPNMQNLPRGRDIKQFFKPDPGHIFVYFDYSQLELRLAAHRSQDPCLLAAYNEGLDLHALTAKSLGVDRSTGKTINFAMVYNCGPNRLQSTLNGVYNYDQCKEFIDEFFQQYRVLKAYFDEQFRVLTKRGCVVSETGRVRRLPDARSADRRSSLFWRAINQGCNFDFQSLGASITKRAMYALAKSGFRLVTQVHDSVICQVPIEDAEQSARDIQEIAEGIYPLTVPLKADVKLLTSLAEDDILDAKEAVNE